MIDIKESTKFNSYKLFDVIKQTLSFYNTLCTDNNLWLFDIDWHVMKTYPLNSKRVRDKKKNYKEV